MNCPNCGKEDIVVDAQISIVAKLDDILEKKLFDLSNSIDYIWCDSCSQGIKLTEDGRLITYIKHLGEVFSVKKVKEPTAKDIRGVLASMPKEKLAELLKELHSKQASPIIEGGN